MDLEELSLKKKEKIKHICFVCLEKSNMKCANCLNIYYCSKIHQK
jgi:hypothetical protein